jgi:hypothetical protein
MIFFQENFVEMSNALTLVAGGNEIAEAHKLRNTMLHLFKKSRTMKETTKSTKLEKLSKTKELTREELKRTKGGDSKNRWFQFSFGPNPCDGKMPH